MTEEIKNRGQIFVFTGPETFLLREKINEWIKLSEKKYGEFNILFTEIDIPKKDSSDIVNRKTKEIASEIITPSFFGEKRVVFLDNFPPSEKGNLSPEDSDKYFNRIITALENMPQENVVIISSENPDKRTKIWKHLVKIAEVESFEKLQDQPLYDWILKRVTEKKGKMLPGAAKFLVEYCGNDLWRLEQEISKLANLCSDKPISEKDIQMVCIQFGGEEVNFALSNAIQSGNKKVIIEVFNREIDNGKSPQEILFKDLATVMRQVVKVTWALENKKTASDIGVHPFVFNNWRNSKGKFTLEKAKAAFGKLLSIEEDSKTGKIDISGGDTRMFSLAIESFLMDFVD